MRRFFCFLLFVCLVVSASALQVTEDVVLNNGDIPVVLKDSDGRSVQKVAYVVPGVSKDGSFVVIQVDTFQVDGTSLDALINARILKTSRSTMELVNRLNSPDVIEYYAEGLKDVLSKANGSVKEALRLLKWDDVVFLNIGDISNPREVERSVARFAQRNEQTLIVHTKVPGHWIVISVESLKDGKVGLVYIDSANKPVAEETYGVKFSNIAKLYSPVAIKKDEVSHNVEVEKQSQITVEAEEHISRDRVRQMVEESGLSANNDAGAILGRVKPAKQDEQGEDLYAKSDITQAIVNYIAAVGVKEKIKELREEVAVVEAADREVSKEDLKRRELEATQVARESAEVIAQGIKKPVPETRSGASLWSKVRSWFHAVKGTPQNGPVQASGDFRCANAIRYAQHQFAKHFNLSMDNKKERTLALKHSRAAMIPGVFTLDDVEADVHKPLDEVHAGINAYLEKQMALLP